MFALLRTLSHSLKDLVHRKLVTDWLEVL